MGYKCCSSLRLSSRDQALPGEGEASASEPVCPYPLLTPLRLHVLVDRGRVGLQMCALPPTLRRAILRDSSAEGASVAWFIYVKYRDGREDVLKMTDEVTAKAAHTAVALAMPGGAMPGDKVITYRA